MLHNLALTEGLRLWIARIDADGGISGIFWGFPGRVSNNCQDISILNKTVEALHTANTSSSSQEQVKV